MTEPEKIEIEYYIATYRGTRVVCAETSDEAIQSVARWARSQGVPAPYADGYRLKGETQWRHP